MSDMAIIAGVNSDGTIQTTANSGKNTTSSTKANDALDKEAFLQLLVAQMKHQDPLQPESNTDYIAQLATFTQVEELQNVGNTLSQGQAADLVGKTVIVKTESASGEAGFISGRVDYMVTENGKVFLGINDQLYSIDDLDTVIDQDYYDTVERI
ncbi:MAG: hypothetical protein E7252_01935 [Lachnospira sp.]|nr:hypothetical protein [Lachnospira sp.]